MSFLALLLVAFLPAALCQTSSEVVCTDRTLDWAFNSAGASPCKVGADLAGVCNGGVFDLTPLKPGFSYLGPTALNQNSCRCSTVYYFMLSACAACQGEQWINWMIYKANCSEVSLSRFPQPIPQGTIVPGWAFTDIVQSDNTFNPQLAQSLDNLPESTGVAAPTLTSRPSFTSGGFATPTLNSGSSGSSSHAGAIAGGVVGGVLGLALIVGLAFLYFRRRRVVAARQSGSSVHATTPYTPAPDDVTESKMPQSGFSSPPPFQPQRLYDPSDPTTFPTASPATNPSYVSVPYSPPPGSTTFQSSNTHVAQHSMSNMPVTSPHPTGNYSGAPEI